MHLKVILSENKNQKEILQQQHAIYILLFKKIVVIFKKALNSPRLMKTQNYYRNIYIYIFQALTKLF